MTTTESKADLSNWRESPHSQWAFANVDKVLRTDLVKKSTQTKELEKDLKQFDDFHIQSKDQKLDLPTFLSATNTDGLVVLQNGKIAFEHYDNGNDATSKHIMMSMTKSVCGLIVGILQGQGKLHENDLVTKYVPEVSNTLYKNVTIRQCIDMRSGAKYYDGNHEYRCAAGWNPENGSEKYTNLHDFIAHFDPERAVDDRFEYVSVNTDLMGWVVERVTGRKFAAVVEELLWEPMGAESEALMAVDKEGNARAAGGMCATVRDIARVGQMVVEGGRGIVPEEWIRDVVSGGDKEAFNKSDWAPGFAGDFDGLAYRSYCCADSISEVVMGIGIHGQMLFADRKNNIVLAKTSSQEIAIDFAKLKMHVLAFKEFRRILLS